MGELSKLGRYELRRTLGQGAMGVVYEGYDPSLGRRVAVKTILQDHVLASEAAGEYSARFKREAKAAGRLSHPNIVQVYDFGVEGKVAYLVMEYIQGKELRRYFDENEPFGLEEKMRIMCELLDALDFAHETGVIHRDVKPANVILDAQRRTKLADFGIARIQDGTELTQGGGMIGTPAYMSPEQITGGKLDGRTDIFSAGSILYEFLTAQRPFPGATGWKMILQKDPPPPSTIAPAVPPAFDAVIAKALAKDLAERFSRARDFSKAIREALAQPYRQGDTVPADQVTERLVPDVNRDESQMQDGQRTSVPGRANEAELEFWRSIKDSNDPDEFDFYLKKFPDGLYTELAEHKSAKLRRAAQPGRKAEGGSMQDAAGQRPEREAEERVRRTAAERDRQVSEEIRKQDQERRNAAAKLPGSGSEYGRKR